MPRLVLVVLLLACGSPPTSESQLPVDAAPRVWVLLIHGSGDAPERWARPLVDRLAPRVPAGTAVEWVAYDWATAAKDRLSAAERGQAEGAAIAKTLEGLGLQHLHLVAHSAGAHVAFGFESAWAGWSERPTLHLTFLDPFLGKGLDFDWGRTRFGASADFVDSWLNRGDGVPGTEVALPNAATFDVTDAATKPVVTGSEGHWWPIEAWATLDEGFSRSFAATGRFSREELRERFPPATTTSLP